MYRQYCHYYRYLNGIDTIDGIDSIIKHYAVRMYMAPQAACPLCRQFIHCCMSSRAGSSATIAGGGVLPMDPSELAALRQAIRHTVLLRRAHSELSAVLLYCAYDNLLHKWVQGIVGGRLGKHRACVHGPGPCCLTLSSYLVWYMQREVTMQPFKRLRPRGIGADIILRPRCEVSHFNMAYEICIHNTVDTDNPAD